LTHALYEVGQNVERQFHSPQEIEGSVTYDQNGVWAIHLLQTSFLTGQDAAMRGKKEESGKSTGDTAMQASIGNRPSLFAYPGKNELFDTYFRHFFERARKAGTLPENPTIAELGIGFAREGDVPSPNFEEWKGVWDFLEEHGAIDGYYLYGLDENGQTIKANQPYFKGASNRVRLVHGGFEELQNLHTRFDVIRIFEPPMRYSRAERERMYKVVDGSLREGGYFIHGFAGENELSIYRRTAGKLSQIQYALQHPHNRTVTDWTGSSLRVRKKVIYNPADIRAWMNDANLKSDSWYKLKREAFLREGRRVIKSLLHGPEGHADFQDKYAIFRDLDGNFWLHFHYIGKYEVGVNYRIESENGKITRLLDPFFEVNPPELVAVNHIAPEAEQWFLNMGNSVLKSKRLELESLLAQNSHLSPNGVFGVRFNIGPEDVAEKFMISTTQAAVLDGLFLDEFYRDSTGVRLMVSQQTGGVFNAGTNEAMSALSSNTLDKTRLFSLDAAMNAGEGSWQRYINERHWNDERRLLANVPKSVREVLLSDSTLQLVFLAHLSSEREEVGQVQFYAARRQSVGLEEIKKHLGYAFAGVMQANRAFQDGQDVAFGVTDIDLRDVNFSEDADVRIANNRQYYVPLEDGTWLGYKGTGAFRRPWDVFNYIDNTVSDISGLFQLDELERTQQAVKQGIQGGAFVESVAFAELIKVPQVAGSRLIDLKSIHPNVSAWISVSRVISPHRLQELPHLLETPPAFEFNLKRISKAIGQPLTGPQLLLRTFAKIGEAQAIKMNKGLAQQSFHQQDVVLGGQIADISEMGTEYESNLFDCLNIFSFLSIYFLMAERGFTAFYKNGRNPEWRELFKSDNLLSIFYENLFQNLLDRHLEEMSTTLQDDDFLQTNENLFNKETRSLLHVRATLMRWYNRELAKRLENRAMLGKRAAVYLKANDAAMNITQNSERGQEPVSAGWNRYLKEHDLGKFQNLQALFTPAIKLALLSDNTLRPIFMQVMPDSSVGAINLVETGINLNQVIEGSENEGQARTFLDYMKKYTVFRFGNAEMADRKLQEARIKGEDLKIVVGITDEPSIPIINPNPVAGGRRVYFPLPDGTWLSVKSSGQNNNVDEPPYYKDGYYWGLVNWREVQRALFGTKEIQETQMHLAAQNGGAVKGSFAPFLAYRQVYKIPDGQGKLVDVPAEAKPVLIYNRFGYPGRLSKLLQFLAKNEPEEMDVVVSKIQKVLGEQGLISGEELKEKWTLWHLLMYIWEKRGENEAIKYRSGLYKLALNVKDISL
jgi:hypothetical protein